MSPIKHGKLKAALDDVYSKPSPGLDVVCMADVQAKAINWLWQPRFAIGKVSVLAGDGGQGKSTILCDIASRVTTAERWPDGADNGTLGMFSSLLRRMIPKTR
jgi:AAA domain